MSARRWVRPKEQPRCCDKCSKPYHRRNLVEAWNAQNPGHVGGWQKTRLRICTRCSDQNQSQRVLLVASVRTIKGGKR